MVANAAPLTPDCTALQSGFGLAWLEAAVPQCQKNARFLAYLGQLLNREARFQDAADHLERALMLEPDLKEAQLSYAIALTGIGDLPTAQALLDQLLQEPDMPETLRENLRRQRDTLVLAQTAQSQSGREGALAAAWAAAAAGWQSRLTLGARWGYDSNLLGAPNLESLTLTFANQTLQLPLDESYLARGGSYGRIEAMLDLQRFEPSGAAWSLAAALRNRTSPGLPAAGSSQLDLTVERRSAPGPWGHYLAASATELQPQNSSRYAAAGVAAGWLTQWTSPWSGDCQARAGADLQHRSYADNAVLSGRYSGLSVSLNCDAPSGLQWGLGLRSGQDKATDPLRPGGDQAQASLRGNLFLPDPLGLPHSALVLNYEVARQSDSTTYSEFIDSGRTRMANRHALRAELQLPTSHNTQWLVGLDWMAQDSNLALFSQRSWGANLGYRFGW